MVQESHYLSRLQDLHWFTWTSEAIRLLNRAGFLVFVTTNQGGVGLGLYPESFVADVHRVMDETLTRQGARVDGWFYCPHHPEATIAALRVECDCRKPRPGMVHQATARFVVDLPRSFVVGDKAADVALAEAVGARGILVRTGYGEDVLAAHGGTIRGAAHVAHDLMEATAWLLVESGHPRT
jgi:D-glycero-D-manno-heptose 1,7-bisphosphate phosphatase